MRNRRTKTGNPGKSSFKIALQYTDFSKSCNWVFKKWTKFLSSAQLGFWTQQWLERYTIHISKYYASNVFLSIFEEMIDIRNFNYALHVFTFIFWKIKLVNNEQSMVSNGYKGADVCICTIFLKVTHRVNTSRHCFLSFSLMCPLKTSMSLHLFS